MTTLVARLSVDKSQTRTRSRVLDLRILHSDLTSVFNDQYSIVQGQTLEIQCKSFMYLYARDPISNVNFASGPIVPVANTILSGLLALTSNLIGQGQKNLDFPSFQGVIALPVGGKLTISQVADSSDTLERYVEILHD